MRMTLHAQVHQEDLYFERGLHVIQLCCAPREGRVCIYLLSAVLLLDSAYSYLVANYDSAIALLLQVRSKPPAGNSADADAID